MCKGARVQMHAGVKMYGNRLGNACETDARYHTLKMMLYLFVSHPLKTNRPDQNSLETAAL